MFDYKEVSKRKYYKYAKDVVEGNIITGEYIRLACKRFMKDLERDDIVFDHEKVFNVHKFISALKHFTGHFNGKPFILQPWQSFIVASIFGFYRYQTNETTGERKLVRKYKYADIECARKTGKSSLIAAICLYCLLCDGEAQAMVDIGATTREQASICFKMCKNYLESIDPKHKFHKPLRISIEVPKTKSTLRCLASDASKLDGGNSFVAVCDEAAAHKSDALYSVLKSSQAMRDNSLLICITTAQFDKSNFFYEKRGVDIEILKGLKSQDDTFIALYEMDETDDWEDESNWIKCQPCLDVTVTKDFMRGQVQEAKNNPTQTVPIKTKTFNMYCDVAKNWIPNNYILDAMEYDGERFDFNFEDYRGCVMYCGVDLSAINDMTGLSFMVLDEKRNKFAFKFYAFLPEETIKNHPNRAYYQVMVQSGYLILTPGNVVDYDYITNILMDIQKKFDIVYGGIFYDPYASTQWSIRCTELGLPVEKFSQSLLNMSPPTKELQRLILKGNVLFDCNPLLTWMFGNCVVKSDWNENIKIIKASDNQKIDLCVCAIESLGGYMIEFGQSPVLFSLDEMT